MRMHISKLLRELIRIVWHLQAGAHQADACAAVINVPKIAMLFLATKGFPHAAMWSMWFQQIRGLVPRDCVAQAFCGARGTRGDPAGFNELIQACGPSSETAGVPSIIFSPFQDPSLPAISCGPALVTGANVNPANVAPVHTHDDHAKAVIPLR